MNIFTSHTVNRVATEQVKKYLYNFYSMGLLSIALSACTATVAPEADLSSEVIQQETIGFANDGVSELLLDIHIIGNARTTQFVENAMTDVATIYEQCEIPLISRVENLPDKHSEDIDLEQLYSLSNEYTARQPTVYIIDSTAERDVAFSYLPSIQRDVSGTAWISNRVSEQCFAWIVAHEIGHILLDDARHHQATQNVMNARCSSNNNFNRTKSLPFWSEQQCRLLKEAVLP